MNYYLVGVGIKGIHSDKPGEKELDFLITYTDKQVDAIKLDRDLVEARYCENKNENYFKFPLSSEFYAASIRAKVQGLMVCLFNSELELERKDLELIVETWSIEELRKAEVHI